MATGQELTSLPDASILESKCHIRYFNYILNIIINTIFVFPLSNWVSTELLLCHSTVRVSKVVKILLRILKNEFVGTFFYLRKQGTCKVKLNN